MAVGLCLPTQTNVGAGIAVEGVALGVTLGDTDGVGFGVETDTGVNSGVGFGASVEPDVSVKVVRLLVRDIVTSTTIPMTTITPIADKTPNRNPFCIQEAPLRQGFGYSTTRSLLQTCASRGRKPCPCSSRTPRLEYILVVGGLHPNALSSCAST